MTTEKEVTPENDPTVDKPKDEKPDAKKNKRHRQSDGQPNRVIIRRLPPTMTEEEFLHQIDPVPKFTAFSFVKPDWTLGVMASSRAYITFENPDEIFVFRDKYDGYVFVDAKGIEYPAVVEYAPFQGFTKTRSKKRDAKMNTIEQDSHYIAFMEALAKAETEIKTETKMEYSYQVKEDTEITSTPLLEYLEGKKKEKQAEKKRKQDEKKKKREEEKMMKKVKLAQKIPEAIKEEGATKKEIKIDQRKEKKEEKRDEKKRSNNEKKEKPQISQEKPSTSKIEPDDDGIVVRVVPSRLDRNQRKKQDEAKEEARRDKRRERDRKRKEERAEREQKNDRERGNRDRNDRDKKSNPPKEKVEVIKVLKRDAEPLKSDQKVDSKPPSQPEPKREVKKYSERRKEIRARAETRRNEAEEKAEQSTSDPTLPKSSSLDVSAEPFIPGKKVETWIVKEGPPDHIEPFPKKSQNDEKTTLDSHSESSAMECCDKSDQKLSKEEEERRRRERAERISNLRNKDRPSIAIYQPRRVRIAANFDQNTDNRDESDAKVEGERQKSGRGEKKRHERRKSHRSSGDEKTEKPRHKKKSITTEDESREMSRQNSQEKSDNEESRENSEKKDLVEPIVEAVQQLAIQETEVQQES